MLRTISLRPSLNNMEGIPCLETSRALIVSVLRAQIPDDWSEIHDDSRWNER